MPLDVLTGSQATPELICGRRIGTQQVFLDGEDVTGAIRTPEIAQAASKVAVVAGVRRVLVAEQRRAGERAAW